MKLIHLLIIILIVVIIVVVCSGKCNSKKMPYCDVNTNLKCIDGEWRCDNYYRVDPDLSSGEQCYPIGMPVSTPATYDNIGIAESTCANLGKDCVYFSFNSNGSAAYSPLGDEDDSKISGFRLAPYSEKIFKRYDGYDMSNIFYVEGNTTTDKLEKDNVGNIKYCEELCVNTPACRNAGGTCSCTEGCFGYVYDKDTGTCSVYTTNRGSGTNKYLKDSV